MSARQTLLLLLILAAATGWFLQRPEAGNPAPVSRKQGPDMFAQQVAVTVMDASGHAVYHIKAEHLLHSPDTGRFDLTQPFIALTRSDGDNWNIASERGQMTDKGDQLRFLGKVDIHRQGSRPLLIQTRDLLVKPDEELAETEDRVSISAPQYKIDAIGLKADLRNGRLEFRSRVRGTLNAAG